MIAAFFSFVAVACIVAMFADVPAVRSAIGLAVLHIVANSAELMSDDWFWLFLLNLAAMAFVVWKPAGLFQAAMGGLFLAGAVKHLAFGLSDQTLAGEMVAWRTGVAVALFQALLLLLYSGWWHVDRSGLWGSVRSRFMVRQAAAANLG